MENETVSKECCRSDCCTTEAEDNKEEDIESFDYEQLKEIVKIKYSNIASSKSEESCGCGCSTDDTKFNSDYGNLSGYESEADLGLGCGLPTEFAGIKSGDTVVDLGSGAGNDVFVASELVGKNGKVIGIDFSSEMIARANKNRIKLGRTNVEFRMGEIENLTIDNSAADVVISNCVLNLVPDKFKAFSEINRTLKPGGHFCISDIVIKGNLPRGLKQSAEIYAGCVSGAIDQEEYLNIISNSGFQNIQVRKASEIGLLDEVLRKYLSDDEIAEFKKSDSGIFSITVTGYKP